MKKTIENIDFRGKKVLVRVDFNVPLDGTKIISNSRIVAALPTLNYILKQKPSKLILLSHLGRVKTKEDFQKKSLRPVAKELANLLRRQVIFSNTSSGDEVEKKLNDLSEGQILVLENTRFEDVLKNKAESRNDEKLGEYWASLADVYINDAFGTAHREHASNVGIAKNVKESAIGYLMLEELKNLSRAVYHSSTPLIGIIGGAKVSDKIKVISNLITKVDYLIIGGGMAYTFLKAQGFSVGNSLVEEDKVELAREYLKQYSHKIILPLDSAISSSFENKNPSYNSENPLEIPEGYLGLDIGPKSIELFRKILSGAKTVIWNGPMGVTEFSNYRKGTEAIAKIIASQPDCFSVIGGGDSSAAIYNLNLESSFSHISTGGGASLQFLEGLPLPGIEAIQEFKPSDVVVDKNPKFDHPIRVEERNKIKHSNENKVVSKKDEESINLKKIEKSHPNKKLLVDETKVVSLNDDDNKKTRSTNTIPVSKPEPVTLEKPQPTTNKTPSPVKKEEVKKPFWVSKKKWESKTSELEKQKTQKSPTTQNKKPVVESKPIDNNDKPKTVVLNEQKSSTTKNKKPVVESKPIDNNDKPKTVVLNEQKNPNPIKKEEK